MPGHPTPLRSTAAPAEWPTTGVEERVGDQVFHLVALPSFEAASAALYGQLKGRGDARLRDDLSPMFGVIWGSARVLAARVAAAGASLRGRGVLELGCGLALPSLVAARAGAHVLATDQHPDTHLLLDENARRNQVRVRYARADVREPATIPTGFDLVLASDVLYAHDLPEPMVAAFAASLAPGGEAWLADPGRPWLDAVLPAAARHGLHAEVDVARVGADEAFVIVFRRR